MPGRPRLGTKVFKNISLSRMRGMRLGGSNRCERSRMGDAFRPLSPAPFVVVTEAAPVQERERDLVRQNIGCLVESAESAIAVVHMTRFCFLAPGVSPEIFSNVDIIYTCFRLGFQAAGALTIAASIQSCPLVRCSPSHPGRTGDGDGTGDQGESAGVLAIGPAAHALSLPRSTNCQRAVYGYRPGAFPCFVLRSVRPTGTAFPNFERTEGHCNYQHAQLTTPVLSPIAANCSRAHGSRAADRTVLAPCPYTVRRRPTARQLSMLSNTYTNM